MCMCTPHESNMGDIGWASSLCQLSARNHSSAIEMQERLTRIYPFKTWKLRWPVPRQKARDTLDGDTINAKKPRLFSGLFFHANFCLRSPLCLHMTNGTPDIFNVDGFASNVSQLVLKLKASRWKQGLHWGSRLWGNLRRFEEIWGAWCLSRCVSPFGVLRGTSVLVHCWMPSCGLRRTRSKTKNPVGSRRVIISGIPFVCTSFPKYFFRYVYLCFRWFPSLHVKMRMHASKSSTEWHFDSKFMC